MGSCGDEVGLEAFQLFQTIRVFTALTCAVFVSESESFNSGSEELIQVGKNSASAYQPNKMNRKGNILVVGSSNTDLVVKTAKLPHPGETVLGGEYFKFHGGKGANQAMAAAKLGGQVRFVGKVGRDDFGKDAVLNLKNAGIDVDFIFKDSETASGIALILVDESGENSIAVASGANSKLTTDEIKGLAAVIRSTDLILVQQEIPLECIYALLELADESGVRVILNPAPAMPLDLSYLTKVFLLIPNENEAEVLTGMPVKSVETAIEAGRAILKKGVKHVVITLGKAGVVYLSQDTELVIPAVEVAAVDTTAAGDTFCGALAVLLAEGADLESAIRFAIEAAGISVTRMGAQASQPYRNEIKFKP